MTAPGVLWAPLLRFSVYDSKVLISPPKGVTDSGYGAEISSLVQ